MFDMFSMAWDSFFVFAVALIVILSILVFVHEWGHYIIARACGVKVTTFSIGFGKELFGMTDKSGTRWKVAMLPLGGYVQMYGDADPASAKEDEQVKQMSEEEKKVAFAHKKLWQKAAIVFAGPAINFIFAIILLFGLYSFVGQPVTPPVASAVIEGSAADEFGIQPYDRITRVNNVSVNRFEGIQREIMIALDNPVSITLERDGEEIVIENVVPKKETFEDRFGFQQSRGMLGILGPRSAIVVDQILAIDGTEVDSVEQARGILSDKMGRVFPVTVQSGEGERTFIIAPLAQHNDVLLSGEMPEGDEQLRLWLYDKENMQVFQKHNPLTAFTASIAETGSIVMNTFEALGQIITGSRSAQELGGLVRIGAIAGDAAQAGLIALITFTALLSINLGLINLFPIPVLDGGHLLFYAIEAVKGSPLSEAAQDMAYKAGFIFIIGLMVFVNINDIVQIVL